MKLKKLAMVAIIFLAAMLVLSACKNGNQSQSSKVTSKSQSAVSKSESSSKKAETVSAYSPKPNASNANPATGVAGGVSLGTAVLLAAIGIARNKGSEDEKE